MNSGYQNQSKTNPKPIENQLKTNNEMECQDKHLRTRIRK